MKSAIVIAIISAFYAALWFPLILPRVEPFGSGGFALHQFSLIAGLVWSGAVLIHLGAIVFFGIRSQRPLLGIVTLELLSVAVCLCVFWMNRHI